VLGLAVNSGGTAAVTRVTGATTPTVLTVGDGVNATPLTIQTGTNTGRVDLQRNAMVVDHPAGSEQATLVAVRDHIVSGYNKGDWKGPGITSTNAATESGKALGYAPAKEVLPFANGATTDTFLGTTVDDTSVVVRYTLAGDATLDGKTDFNDLVKLAQNYNTTVSTTTDSWWTHGDFTYDGITDFNDLVKLAQNYNTALPSEAIPGAPVNFEADLARAFAQAPEPSALALATIAACGFAIKRRRRRATW
jgi:hypothetical protein